MLEVAREQEGEVRELDGGGRELKGGKVGAAGSERAGAWREEWSWREELELEGGKQLRELEESKGGAGETESSWREGAGGKEVG